MANLEVEKLIKELTKILYELRKPKTEAYDTKAIVRRIDGNTAWVHIDGGVDETPVELTINAGVGDTVLIRASGGRAWISGNVTSPPTDDTTANIAKKVALQASEDSQEAKEYAEDTLDIANDAEETAQFALQSANGKNTVYYGAEEPEPPEGGFQSGDTWFNSSEDNAIYTWDETEEEWIKKGIGNQAVSNLDAGKITTGYIDAGRINTLGLSVGSGRTLGDEFDDIDDDIEELGNQIEAVYGECSTSASTAIKVVTCDGFVPFTGATIAVDFTYGNNTAIIPKLKIVDDNNQIVLDTKDVYFNGVIASTSNYVLWTANTTITFLYDGSKWNVVDKASTYYITSSTSGSYATKYFSMDDMLIVKGTTVVANIAYPNTATDYLYFNFGCGSMPVRVKGTMVYANEFLDSGKYSEKIPVTMSGQSWEYQDAYAAGTASRYITYIDDDSGIHVHDGVNTSDYAQLNSDGMTVYKDDTPVAFFGDFISLNGTGNNDGVFSTVATSNSLAVNADGDPTFMVQGTGDTKETNVYALKTMRENKIYSSAQSTKTKTWDLRLAPNTYKIYFACASSQPADFTITENTYVTGSRSASGVQSYSTNNLTITFGSPEYENGKIVAQAVHVVQTAGPASNNNKKITWSAMSIYSIKEIYTSDVLWNGNLHKNVGDTIIRQGGIDYTDDDGQDLRSNVVMSGAGVTTLGYIDLDEGVYLVETRVRFSPTSTTNNGKVFTSLMFGSTSDDASMASTQYGEYSTADVSNRGGWKYFELHDMFIATPSVEDPNAESDGRVRYYISVYANAAGTWYRNNAMAFHIRSVKIR